MKVKIGEERLVYSVPVNEITNKWGVYAIPRMWRDISGKIIIRLNGEADTGDTDNMSVAPNLYFVSEDNGKTWEPDKDGDKNYPIDILNGIGLHSTYTKTGDITLAFREKADRGLIKNTSSQKEFLYPNDEAYVKSYRYGDISDDAKGVERLKYQGGNLEITPVTIDFPEREILINSKGFNGEEYVKVEERVKQSIFKNTYFCSVTLLDDGTLVAVSTGQNPEVSDHYSGVAYLIESNDMGLTWKKRSTIAESKDMPYGFTGDGHEISMTRTKNGTLICAMRTEMSINPEIATPICDTFIAISHDNGYTWDTPFSISDSSVTPQIMSFENGVVIVVYGRPGVHFKYSLDDGKTWSKSYAIIGETLEETRAKGISDLDSKYADTQSYSNIFIEKLDENSVLVLYNNMKYIDSDGKKHKAAFVREVSFIED